MSKGNLFDIAILAAAILPIPGLQQAAWTTALVRLGIIATATYAKSRLLRGSGGVGAASGMAFNLTSTEASLPIIYGVTKVTPAMVDIQQDPGQEKTLVEVLALAVGEIEAVLKVWFDEVLAIDAPVAGNATQNSGVQIPWSASGIGSTYGTDLWFMYGLHLGTDAQATDTELDARFTNYGATDAGVGIAYLALLLYYNEAIWTTGRPNVTALVKGRKVYDTRTATTAWSDNSALCIRDWMTSTRYGMGIPEAKINDASISAAANYCDVLVSIPGGGTQKRYTCNGALDPTDDPRLNLRRLLSSCRGAIVRIGGQYHLVIRQVTTAETFEFTEANIIGGIEIVRGGIAEAPNAITATYIDPDLFYQANDVSWPESGAANSYLTEDNSFLSRQEIDLPFTHNRYMAQQIGQVLLKEGRQDLVAAFTSTREALKVKHGDVVKVTHSTPAWTQKEFFIIAIGPQPDGLVRVIVREYDASAYSLDAGSAAPTVPNTNLPDPTTCIAPTGLTLTSDNTTAATLQDATVVPRIKVQWTASADAFLAGYEVRLKRTADADSTYQIVALPSAGDVQTYLANVINGTGYTVGIRAVNAIGVRSAWVSGTVTVSTSEGAASAVVTAYLDGTALRVRRTGGTAQSLKYFVKDTEPNLAEVQGGTLSTSSPVTVHTFTAPGTKWVGILLYTNAGGTANESALQAFPVTYQAQTAGVLDETSGGTGQNAWTTGDLPYASAADTLAKRAIGAAAALLQVVSGLPDWKTALIGYLGHAMYDNGTKSADFNWDASNGNIQKVTLSASVTITLTNFAEGKPGVLFIKYTGAYTPTFSGLGFGDITPTYSAASGKLDWVHAVPVGNVVVGSASTGHTAWT